MMIKQNRDTSTNSIFHQALITLICLLTGLSTPIFAQNVKTCDSIIICNRPRFTRSETISPDTFLLRMDVDSALCRTWFIDKFSTNLNDSIKCLFDFGIEKVYLTFDLNNSIDAYGTGYGFEGIFRIARNNRILVISSGNNAVYYAKSTLNSAYQNFWRSFVPLLHESKYSIRGDSLFLFFQTGSAILIDSVKVTDTYLKTKQWPSKKR